MHTTGRPVALAVAALAVIAGCRGSTPGSESAQSAAVAAPSAAVVKVIAGRLFALVGEAPMPASGERVELPERGETLVTDLAPCAPRNWTLVGNTSPGRCEAEAIATGSIGLVSDDAVLGALGTASVVELRPSGCTAQNLERAVWLAIPETGVDASLTQLAVTETVGDLSGEHGGVAMIENSRVRVVSRGFGERPFCVPDSVRVDFVLDDQTLASYPDVTASWVAQVGDASYLPLFDLMGRTRLIRISGDAVTEVFAGGFDDPVDVEGCDE